MAINSINTNSGAMIALQNLNNTASDLRSVQQRISTGPKVGSAKAELHANATTTLGIHLTRRAAAKLRSLRSVALTLRVTVTDEHANKATGSKRVVLRRK